MADPLETADHFDKAVRSTSAFGALDAKVDSLATDVTEIKRDVKAMRSTMDRWGGAIAMMSAVISVAVSLVVAVFRIHP